MEIPEQPPRIDVAHDILNGVECGRRVRAVVHGEDNTREDLKAEHQSQYTTKRVKIIEIARDWIGDKGAVDQPGKRHSRIDPSPKPCFRDIH